jgi:DNA-binding LacI/PurR family transcriptional regulator
MVTIRDIAKKANVSVATVSYALSGNTKKASLSTIQMIKRVAREMNYRPNLLARSLSQSKSHSIGLLYSDFANPFFIEILKGAHDRCVEDNYNLIVRFPQGDLASELAHLQSLIDARVDGLIICPVIHYTAQDEKYRKPHAQCIKELAARKIPICSFSLRFPHYDIPSITYDVYDGGRRMMEHLLGLGHRKIAFLSLPFWPSGDQGFYTMPKDRYDAYSEVLAAHHIKPDPKWILECDNGRKQAYDAVMEYIKCHGKDFTALFCYNDYLALGAIRAFLDLGYRVPEDVAVVGCDDIEEAAYGQVPLTTLHLLKYEVGKMLVEMVFKEIETGASDNTIQMTLKPNLVIRQSCGYSLLKH